MSNTLNLFSRLGGEAKQEITQVSTRNAQAEFRPDVYTNLVNPITISSARFDSIVAFFQKKGISESLARTYGNALIEISQETGKDVSELVDFDNFSETDLNETTVTTINRLRNKTAQIGYITDADDMHQTQTKRSIR